LNLLSIFYFVLCGMQCFGLLLVALYMVFLIVMAASGGFGGGAKGPPPGFFTFTAAIMGVSLIISGTLAICLGLTGSYLRKRKHPVFCFVIACIICLNVPLGTILGVFTIMVLQRESVNELFQYGDQPPGLDARPSEDEDGYYPR
jgi:hypothetical protein